MAVPVREGEVVGGKYRVERVLGIGGMGVVVAARHEALARRVAIKLMLPKALQRSGARERFLREARAAVRLRGAHVAQVFDVGTLESGIPYIVMEYLEGRDLQSRVEEAGSLFVAEAVDLVLQACEALAEAHALGIVHRDLKPENLFLTEAPDGGPLVKVLDFGISKWKTEAEKTLTGGAAVMGSPAYMSPEQMRSTRDVDARTDIWSLGVILHQLVSGRLPFEADSVPELFALVSKVPPPPLARPDVPKGFDAVVRRCLARDRSDRFADVAELAAAVAPYGSDGARDRAARIAKVLAATRASANPQTDPDAGGSEAVDGAVALVRAPPGQTTVAAVPAATPATRIGTQPSARRRPAVVLLVAGGLLAVAIGGAVVAMTRDEPVSERPTVVTPHANPVRDTTTQPPRVPVEPPGTAAEPAPVVEPEDAAMEPDGGSRPRERLGPKSRPRRARAAAPDPDDDDVFRTRR